MEKKRPADIWARKKKGSKRIVQGKEQTDPSRVIREKEGGEEKKKTDLHETNEPLARGLRGSRYASGRWELIPIINVVHIVFGLCIWSFDYGWGCNALLLLGWLRQGLRLLV